jgi:tetratricopeptide (TPR) repeat protein
MTTAGAAVLLVGYCLVLTKSRTAWIGVLAGCGLWGVLQARRHIPIRSAAQAVAAGAVVVAVLGSLAWWSGALDRLVLTETPKSLRYRLEYWTGTWGVIREAPLLGVGGTGNFRQHYLGHKLPGSSEEVLDPHNFVLDVWVNGGLVALLGLAGVLWCFASRVCQAVGPVSSENDSTAALGSSRAGNFQAGAGWVGAFALLLLLAQEWALEAVVDWQLLWLLGSWIVAAWLIPRTVPPLTAIVAAGGAWLVHLLGAGGIAMPAVNTVLLLLLLGPRDENPSARVANDTLRPQRRGQLEYFARLAAMLVAGVTAFLIPSVPVSLARTYVAAGEALLSQRGDPADARRYFQQAAEADPLDPDPWHDLAQLDYAASMQGGAESRAAFDAAIANLQQAIQRDPYAPKLHWMGARWCLERLSSTNDSVLAAAALEFAEAAVVGYPHDAGIRATLAEAYAAGGHTPDASREAGRALELDDLNRQLGHYDRVFNEQRLRQLRALADSGAGGPEE